MKKKHLTYLLAGLIALLTFVVYLPSLQNDFVEWDDNIFIYLNPFIQSLDKDFFKWAFFDIYYAYDWTPLTWVSHAVDYAIWGLNPAGHHLTSIIIHAVNTFLLVLLVIRLIGASRDTRDSEQSSFYTDNNILIAASVTGLLFGIHPLHVESVAWVAERKDVLCALFFLLTLLMYTKYGSTEPATRSLVSRFVCKWYLLSIGFFLLSLMSKPMAVSLPVVLLILDWYPLQRIRTLRSFRSALFEKTPFIALALFSSIITYMAKKQGAMELAEHLGLPTRLLVASKSLVMYIWKMIFPHPLVPMYPYPREVSFLSFDYFIPPLFIVGITIACVVAARKRIKLWIAVWVYYVVTLIPVLGIIQTGGQAMADRYTYLPSIGPFLVAGLLVAWITEKANKSPGRNLLLKRIGISMAVALLVATSYLTVKQIKIWKNTMVLFNHVIEESPVEFYLAYSKRGRALLSKGHIEEALKDFDRVIDLNPYYHVAYFYRAAIFEKKGEIDRAIEDYNTAIEEFRIASGMDPRDYEIYTRLGVLYGKSNSLGKAIESFNKAIEINPGYPLAYGNRGHAYSLAGDIERAIEDLSRAIALDNGYVKAYVNRGNLYLTSGREELAGDDFQKACALGDGEACTITRTLQNPVLGESQ
jgi:Flp pilus assembly protein TadD